jgi:hypothetical protein
MKFENIKNMINEEYDDFDTICSKIKSFLKSLEKTYDDKTIMVAFETIIRDKKSKK